MKDLLWKSFPIVAGILLGWLLVHPPDVLDEAGLLAPIAGGLLVALLLVAVVAIQIDVTLVESPVLVPLPDYTGDERFRGLVAAIESLGFVRVGPALRVEIKPAAVLLPLLSEDGLSYASVFETGTRPAKVTFDFVSILHGDRGGLTSTPEASGAVLPAGEGALRQVVAGADPVTLLRHHREALDWLRQRGLGARSLDAAGWPAAFREGLRRQRAAFRRRPLRSAAVVLWRVATKSSPWSGPLGAQAGIEDDLRSLATGFRGR